MTFDSLSLSVQDGRPVNLYTIASELFTYRFTSYDEDVTFGNVYTAIGIDHNPPTTVPIGQSRSLSVTLPVDHELCGVLRGNGIPPRGVQLTIVCLQGGEIRQIWRGEIAEIESDDEHATLKVPSAIDEKLRVRLPIARAQRTCNHMLYDTGCATPRQKIVPTQTVAAPPSGTTIVISTTFGAADGHFKHGEAVRVVDGQRRSILEQIGTTLTIDVPFSTLNNGDLLDVFVGCDRSIDACLAKFDNVANFGGHPEMPENNPSAPTGLGVVVQT